MASRLLEILIESESDLRKLAERIATLNLKGLAFGLQGSLGAGKTTFVRFLVDALGGRDPVSSPTFTIEHEYSLERGSMLEHWDLYRLHDLPEELSEAVGVYDIRIVEWPDRFPEYAETLDVLIDFSFDPKDETFSTRIITLYSDSIEMGTLRQD